LTSARVSIIIVNYNGLSLPHPNLSDCLSALSSQDFKDYEAILVDNCSTDASVNYVRSNYPRVTLVQLTRNYGFALANNIGLRFAAGEYVVLLNNDAVPLQGWLRSLVSSADQHLDYEIFASIQLPDQRSGKTRDLNVYGGVCVYDRGRGVVLPSLFASGAVCLIRRSWINKLGYLFDETFGTFAEDLDLSIRTILAGGQIAYVASSMALHHPGSTWRFYCMNSTYMANRNEIMAYFKALGIRSFMKVIVARMVYIALRTFVKPRELPKNLSMLVGLLAGVLNLPLHLRERTRFSRIKIRSDRYLLARLKLHPVNAVGTIMWRFMASRSLNQT